MRESWCELIGPTDSVLGLNVSRAESRQPGMGTDLP